MGKPLSFGALGIGALMAVIFLLDLVVGIPFGGGPFVTADIFGLLGSVIVAYLGWNAARDLR